MGTTDKEKVQLVISHLEGCSGNFIGRLFAQSDNNPNGLFRIDVNLDPLVLSIDGRMRWADEITRLEQHLVVVTHNYDTELIRKTFPNARTLAIYPYTHLGNVLYNICFKKLTYKLDNMIDNHLLHLKEWHQHLLRSRPNYDCLDFGHVSDLETVEKCLETKFTHTQKKFFEQYWAQQMTLPLDIPRESKTIEELIELWMCQDRFDEWFVAWTIYVYELINNLDEAQRTWSIDTYKFRDWNDVANIQSKYNDSTIPNL